MIVLGKETLEKNSSNAWIASRNLFIYHHNNIICMSTKQDLRINIDFSKYKGKYVALIGKKIVASGKNAKTVLDTTRAKHPKEEIVLRKIPKEETLILVI